VAINHLDWEDWESLVFLSNLIISLLEVRRPSVNLFIGWYLCCNVGFCGFTNFEWFSLLKWPFVPYSIYLSWRLSFEGIIKHIKHCLLVNIILFIDFSKESLICLISPLCQFFPIFDLINLFIYFLNVEIVLRRIRAASIWCVFFRIVFFFNFNILICLF
jgi:hypothetical protein